MPVVRRSCFYRKALGVRELTDTLTRLESKMDILVNNSTLQVKSYAPNRPQQLPSLPVQLSQQPNPLDGSFQSTPELAIPRRHLTAPQHMLSWPSSPITLTDLERRYPLDKEFRKPKQADLTSSATTIQGWLAELSTARLRIFIGLYFTHLHPQYLILDEDYFYSQHLQYALRNGFEDGVGSCLVLSVLALGVMISRHLENPLSTGHGATPERPDCELGLLRLAQDKYRNLGETDWTNVQYLLLKG
jgi:hypothetical protein